MGRGFLLPKDKKVTKTSVFQQVGRILQEAEEAIMREILAKDITAAVKKLCIDANTFLPEDVKNRICAGHACEPWPLAK